MSVVRVSIPDINMKEARKGTSTGGDYIGKCQLKRSKSESTGILFVSDESHNKFLPLTPTFGRGSWKAVKGFLSYHYPSLLPTFTAFTALAILTASPHLLTFLSLV